MVKKILISTVVLILSLEILLRLTGIFNVYSEKIGMGYASNWGYSHNSHYKVLPQSSHIQYNQKELTISFQSNNIGMRNGEVMLKQPDSVYRIICLGDSFTEGDGAAYGYSYPRQLETLLNENAASGQYFEVINAGKNGSDIIYAEKILTSALYEFQPNLILMAINDTDIDDIIQRGGKERFKENNTTEYKKGPRYETIYQHSHFFRMVIHKILLKNRLFLSRKQSIHENEIASEMIENSMIELMDFCKVHNIEIRFIIHPLCWQISEAEYRRPLKKENSNTDNFHKISKLSGIQLDQIPGTYNLFPLLTERFADDEYQKYAWPINGHFNAYGYGVFANEVYKQLMKDSTIINLEQK